MVDTQVDTQGTITEDEHRMAQTGGVSYEEAAEVIKAGYPPMADKVILCDFDGTLYPFGHLFDYTDPLPGAVEAIKFLVSKGFKIMIFTSRLSDYWLESVNQSKQKHIDYINYLCDRDGIDIIGITADKIPAQFYIDDRAIRFTGSWLTTMKDVQDIMGL